MNNFSFLCKVFLLTFFPYCEIVPAVALSKIPTSYLSSKSITIKDQYIGLTLSDVIYLGLRNNYTIKSAYLQRISQKFDLRVAEDSFTPKLQLNAQDIAGHDQYGTYKESIILPTAALITPYGTRFSLSWNQMDSRSSINTFRSDGVSLEVIQPLLRGAGKEITTAPLQLAQLDEQLNKLTIKATLSDTITQIILAYREMLRSQEQLKITHDALERSRQLLYINEALISAGRMAQVDIVQTQADLAMQELASQEAEDQLTTSRVELLKLLALNLRTKIHASDKLEEHSINIDTDKALSQAKSNQPIYLAQLIAVKQASINLMVAKNNRLWDVSLLGGTSQIHNKNSSISDSVANRNWDNYIGIKVEIPVGDLSQRQAEVQANVALKSQNNRLEEVELNLEQQVENSVRDTITRERQYHIAKKISELSLRKLDIEKEKLQAGRSSNFQVLSFEADLRNAENIELTSLINYLNAQTELDDILGTTLDSWEISLNE